MYREKIFGVLAKIETTSGVDAVPVPATDAVRVVGVPTLTYEFLEGGARDDVQMGQLGRPDRAAPAGRYGKIDITLEVKGAGAAYAAAVAPEGDVFWRMSGFGRTLVVTPGAESIAYTTLDTGMETATLYLYSAGKLFKLIGCVAQPKLTAETLKRGLVSFSVTGKIASDPTEAALPALTFGTVIPPLFHSGLATIGTWRSDAGSDPLVLHSVALDFGTAIAERPSAGATDGLIGYGITDRAVRQTMEVEVPSLASFDAYAMAKATGAALPASTSWQIGTAQYNRLKVTTGRWSLMAPKLGAKNALATHTLDGGLVMGTEATSSREIRLLFD